MPTDGLPPGFARLFTSDEAAGRTLDVELPPGRLVEPEGATRPAYWLSDDAASPDLWVRLHRAFPRSGLWPVFATSSDFHDERPWVAGEVNPAPVADIDRVRAADVLAGFWNAWTEGAHHLSMDSGDPLRPDAGFTVAREGGFPEREPFGTDWPGLAASVEGTGDPDEFADRHVPATDDGTSRIMLVPAPRSADVLTSVGWQGAVNHVQETFPLSAVLRSWEDRFGARVVEIGFDTIDIAVAAAPATPEQAELVAAEHFAFCPDNIVQGMSGTIRDYAAAEVLGRDSWSFWWD